jgi:hypothetical protein
MSEIAWLRQQPQNPSYTCLGILMKLIDYDRYTRKWSPRSTVLLAVVESIVTGFFLSASLFEFLRGRDVWTWITPLVMAFASGVGALLATLVALHNCPSSAGGQ